MPSSKYCCCSCFVCLSQTHILSSEAAFLLTEAFPAIFTFVCLYCLLPDCNKSSRYDKGISRPTKACVRARSMRRSLTTLAIIQHMQALIASPICKFQTFWRFAQKPDPIPPRWLWDLHKNSRPKSRGLDTKSTEIKIHRNKNPIFLFTPYLFYFI